MKKGIDLPTTEMRGDMPFVVGSYTEENPPNDLNDKRISELAYQSAFAFQPEGSCTAPKVEK